MSEPPVMFTHNRSNTLAESIITYKCVIVSYILSPQVASHKGTFTRWWSEGPNNSALSPLSRWKSNNRVLWEMISSTRTQYNLMISSTRTQYNLMISSTRTQYNLMISSTRTQYNLMISSTRTQYNLMISSTRKYNLMISSTRTQYNLMFEDL